MNKYSTLLFIGALLDQIINNYPFINSIDEIYNEKINKDKFYIEKILNFLPLFLDIILMITKDKSFMMRKFIIVVLNITSNQNKSYSKKDLDYMIKKTFYCYISKFNSHEYHKIPIINSIVDIFLNLVDNNNDNIWDILTNTNNQFHDLMIQSFKKNPFEKSVNELFSKLDIIPGEDKLLLLCGTMIGHHKMKVLYRTNDRTVGKFQAQVLFPLDHSLFDHLGPDFMIKWYTFANCDNDILGQKVDKYYKNMKFFDDIESYPLSKQVLLSKIINKYNNLPGLELKNKGKRLAIDLGALDPLCKILELEYYFFWQKIQEKEEVKKTSQGENIYPVIKNTIYDEIMKINEIVYIFVPFKDSNIIKVNNKMITGFMQETALSGILDCFLVHNVSKLINEYYRQKCCQCENTNNHLDYEYFVNVTFFKNQKCQNNIRTQWVHSNCFLLNLRLFT